MFNKIFLGDVPITKIYLGTKLIKYNLNTSIPPKFLSNVTNFTAEVNKPIEMYYTASDDLGIVMHEFYDGSTWRRIYPTSIENTHYFTLTFDTTGTKQCQIRISDADNNEVTSNTFELVISQPVVVDAIYASDSRNTVFALNSSTLAQLYATPESGTVGALLKMDKNLYVANNTSTTILRYTDKLQRIDESNSVYDPVIALLGNYSASNATNYIYAILPTMIIRHTHNASLSDRKVINNFDSDFKYAVYANNQIYTLRQDNRIVIYDNDLNKLRELSNTDTCDTIVIDNEYIYKIRLSSGVIIKLNPTNGTEISRSSTNSGYSMSVNIGNHILTANKFGTTIQLIDKNSYSVFKTQYMMDGVASLDVDDEKQLIYIGNKKGGVSIMNYANWRTIKTVNGIGTESMSNITV